MSTNNSAKKSRFQIERLEDRIAPCAYAWGGDCCDNGGSNHGGSNHGGSNKCGGSDKNGGSDKCGGSKKGGSVKCGGSKKGGSDKCGGSKKGGSNKDKCNNGNHYGQYKAKCK